MLSLTESSRIERVVLLTQLFLQSGELRTSEAADLTGVSRRTIQRDLAEIARVLPIYPDYAGRWIYTSDEARVAEIASISPY